jgi:hypothetical protein
MVRLIVGVSARGLIFACENVSLTGQEAFAGLL